MVLEATMIALDNSEAMRNGDYAPTRFQAQADAINILCGAKTQVCGRARARARARRSPREIPARTAGARRGDGVQRGGSTADGPNEGTCTPVAPHCL